LYDNYLFKVGEIYCSMHMKYTWVSFLVELIINYLQSTITSKITRSGASRTLN
jgi:hypothetical protein